MFTRRSSRAVSTTIPQTRFVPAAAAPPAPPAEPPMPINPPQPMAAPPPLPPNFEAMKTEEKPMECDDNSKPLDDPVEERKRLRKLLGRVKKHLPAHLRRRKYNKILSRVSPPKSAITFLHELRPGCVYNFTQMSIAPAVNFRAEVMCDGKILGVGQGGSKAMAKNDAAEKSIRTLISTIITETQAQQKEAPTEPPAEGAENEAEDEKEEGMPWAGIASFAMFKLFAEWQQHGLDIPLNMTELKAPKPANNAADAEMKVPRVPKPPPALPANPLAMHPCALLNLMVPDTPVQELERKFLPTHSTTVAYNVNGQQFIGTAPNKKSARKEAAKKACASLFGVIYPEEK